jgi:hypothetical protein
MGMGFVRLAEGQNGLRANFSSVRIIDGHVRRLGDEGRERKVARIQLNYRPGVGLGQRGRGPESRLLDCDCANLHFPAAIATPNCGNSPIWGGFNFGHKHASPNA